MRNLLKIEENSRFHTNSVEILHAFMAHEEL